MLNYTCPESLLKCGKAKFSRMNLVVTSGNWQLPLKKKSWRWPVTNDPAVTIDTPAA
jgi:hypothetical protein